MKLNKNWVGVLALTLLGLLIGLTGGQAAATVMTFEGFYALGVFLGVFWYAVTCGMLVTAEILYREGR